MFRNIRNIRNIRNNMQPELSSPTRTSPNIMAPLFEMFEVALAGIKNPLTLSKFKTSFFPLLAIGKPRFPANKGPA